MSAGRSEGVPLRPIYADGFFDCDVKSLNLVPGVYRINLSFFSSGSQLDLLIGCAGLRVSESGFNGRTMATSGDRGILMLQERWS